MDTFFRIGNIIRGLLTIIGFLSTISVLIFTVLQNCGIIDWPWWAILAPFWGYSLLAFVLCLIFLAIYFIISAVTDTTTDQD